MALALFALPFVSPNCRPGPGVGPIVEYRRANQKRHAFGRAEALPAPTQPARRQADTRRAVHLRDLAAATADKVQSQSCDHDRTVMFVRPIQFSKNRPRPSRGIGPRMLAAPHPAGRSPRFRPRRSIFGEPSKLIKTGRGMSSAFCASATFVPWPASRRRPHRAAWRWCCLGRQRLSGDGFRRRATWSCFPCVRLGGPEPGLLGDVRRKRILMIRAEGGLVNPIGRPCSRAIYRSLRRPRTPARLRGSLPHIRQANVLATQ
jgi:hypothetical protein